MVGGIARAHVTSLSVRDEQREEALRWIDEGLVPALRQKLGFQGLLLLNEEVEEEPGGEWLAVLFWENVQLAEPGVLADFSDQLKAVGIGIAHPRFYEVVRRT